MAKSTGKLDDLSAAVSVAAMDSTRAGIAQAYDATKTRAEEAYDAAKEHMAVVRTASESREARHEVAASANIITATPLNAGPVINGAVAGTPTIIIENPEQVIVQAPEATGTTGMTEVVVATERGITPAVAPIQDGDGRSRLDE